MKKVVITTDCVCDMPESLLEKYDIKVIYFYIMTEHGWFKDMDEITSGNIVEYFERGGQQVQTKAPFPEEYEMFFRKVLEDAEEIIHIAVTSTLSLSCKNAREAAEKCDGRVHIVDTEHLSTGMAHLVIKGAELAKSETGVQEILSVLEKMKRRVSTSFIAENANYLYRTGHVSKFVKNVCELFQIHPVLGIKKGVMGVKGVQIGNYEKSVMRYVRKEMRHVSQIDKERLFITHASCSLKLITKVKNEVARRCIFHETLVTEASATISSNCGANTIGVLYVRGSSKVDAK